MNVEKIIGVYNSFVLDLNTLEKSKLAMLLATPRQINITV